MQEMPLNDLQILMVETFQCPGCTCGYKATKQEAERGKCTFPIPSDGLNECFVPCTETLSCKTHSAGTFLGGVGNINLGLPKGFNRLGPIDKSIQSSNIRLQYKIPSYDSFNIPLWALEEDGYLFVVVALPRLQQFWVDVVPNGKISDLPENVVDVSKLDLSQCV